MNMKKDMKGKRQKKRITGTVTAVLAILILLSGTFAWYYVTNAINEFGGKRDDYVGNSAVLHDDFEEKGVEKDGTLIHNKDVYVENTGTNSIFVRLRLDEYMEIDGESLIPGADKMNEATWKTHIPTIGADVCKEKFHDYWKWDLGGGTQYVPNAKGTKGVVSQYDKDGNDTLVENAVGNKETLRKIPGDSTSGVTEVITMAEYNKLTAAQKNTYYGWVYDTDGYAYWSQKLVPNEATGLLLDQVTLKSLFGDEIDYYYAINVILETVDEDDLDAWLTSADTIDGKKTDEATADGKDLLKGASDQYSRITDEMKEEVPPADKYDKDGDGFLDEDELEKWLEDQGEIVKGEDDKYYRPRPDLGPGKGDIYEEVDKKGEPLDPERIIDSGADRKPGTSDDEEWTKITDEMNEKEPPARDFDKDGDGYLTPDDKAKWEEAVKEENNRKETTPVSLTATTNGAKFKEGAVLKASDIEVKVKYLDGTIKTITTGFSWTPNGGLKVGDNVVTVSYEETPTAAKFTDAVAPVKVEGKMTVVAEAKVLTSIEITTQPTTKDYVEGEKFNPAGMVVKANYDNGTNNPNVTGYKCTPEDALTTEVTSITVSYTEEGVTKTATVTGIKVESAKSEDQKAIEEIGNKNNFEEVSIGGRTWIILSKDETKGTAELLSKDIITSRVWNYVGASWGDSDIKTYLNGTYFGSLPNDFKKSIEVQRKSTNKWGSALTATDELTTDNKVYLLSYSEYIAYDRSFSSEKGISLKEYGVSTTWWLRSPDYNADSPDSNYACAVSNLNGIARYSNVSSKYGIRPALTVKYE